MPNNTNNEMSEGREGIEETKTAIRKKLRSTMYLAECHELQYQAVEPVVFEIIHQELQKARESWLEEIKPFLVHDDSCCLQSNDYLAIKECDCGLYKTLTKDQSELDQPIS